MTDLFALRAKYAEMRALRSAGSPPDKARLVSLASVFPGALRELDEIPPAALDARIAQIDHALASGDEAPWMRATIRYHSLTRTALIAKRWLGARKHVDEPTRDAFARDHASSPALEWHHALDRIARPPERRISNAVLERLASELGIGVDEARDRVMPHARVRRR